MLASEAADRCRLRVEIAGLPSAEQRIACRSRDVAVVVGPRFEAHIEVVGSLDGRSSAGLVFLSAAEIETLPDDPDAMREALLSIAGPDAAIRIDGFAGGRLPPKSQIQQIRFRLAPYSAENHTIGETSVDVTTRPGRGPWGGEVTGNLKPEGWSEPQAPATSGLRQSSGRAYLAVDGPLVRHRTALSISAEALEAVTPVATRVILADGVGTSLVAPERHLRSLSLRVDQALSASSSMWVSYSRQSETQDPLGVGPLSLPETAYAASSDASTLRLSSSASFGRTAINELRIEYQSSRVRYEPRLAAPGVIVQGAFVGGGAQIRGADRTESVRIADDFDIKVRGRAVRAGFDFCSEWLTSDVAYNAAGTYVFASTEDWSAGKATTFARNAGDPRLKIALFQGAAYIQSEFRFGSRLSVSPGVRQEWQRHLGSWFNPGPRLGFSLVLSSALTLRGGVGLSREWLDDNVLLESERHNGRHVRPLIVENPSYPLIDADDSLRPLVSRVVRSPALDLSSRLHAGLALELAIGPAMTTAAAYSFRRGGSEYASVNANPPGPEGFRPTPDEGNITVLSSNGRHGRHQLSVHLNKWGGARRRWGAHVNYRLAFARSEADAPLMLPAGGAGLRDEWGADLHDVRHRAYATVYARLPYRLRLSLNGNVSSAAPYGITTGIDSNHDGIANERPPFVARNSGRGGGVRMLDADLSWNLPFGGASRVSPAQGLEADALETAGKRGRLSLALRVSNLLNTVNETGYVGVQTSLLFGTAVSARRMRSVEVVATAGWR